MRYGSFQVGWKQFGQYGLRRAFGASTLGQGGGPRVLPSLFARGEQGFVFSRLSTKSYLFQNSTKTTPVAANNDPVGAVVDLSPNRNDAIQATAGSRPLWVDNSGVSYLSTDGSDDRLVSGFVPTAALTMAVAFRPSGFNCYVMGGGAATGNKRAYIGVDGSQFLNIGMGTIVSQGSVSRNGQDTIVVVTGDGVSAPDIYINGVLTSWGSFTGGPDGTGSGFALGSVNNAGTQTNFMAARIYFAMALNRKVTADEVVLIEREAQGSSPAGIIPFLSSEQARNFAKTDGYAVSLAASYYSNGLTYWGGAVWIFRWSDIETSDGVYDFTNLDASLAWCAEIGRASCRERV